MARSDYEHWNEEADYMWWNEEGKHVEEPPEPDDDEMFAHRDRDEEVEHHTKDDCIVDGNFSRPGATRVWECDDCGKKYPEFGEWPPLRGE